MLKAESKKKLIKNILISIRKTGTIDASKLSGQFDISKKGIYQYVNDLIDKDEIQRIGKGKYELKVKNYIFEFENKNLREDEIWKLKIEPLLPEMTKEAKQALIHIFTEIFNNAIDHSKSEVIDVTAWVCSLYVRISIIDYGIGIFENIKNTLNLSDKKHAILELAKGKFTSEPNSHSGEGIFFSSKMADAFIIMSDELSFITNSKLNDGFLLTNNFSEKGTAVGFSVSCDSKINLNEIYKKYTEMPESFGFTKTAIPVKLLGYGENEVSFISRSQAKRLLLRFERFENVMLDFEGVESIGQGFADEVFRVFNKEHPGVKITPINCNQQVNNMIAHVTNNK